MLIAILFGFSRCGNVASILELDEHLGQEYKVFQHAPVVSHRFDKLLPINHLTVFLPPCSLGCFLLISIFVQIISPLLAGHNETTQILISGCSINSRETSSCGLFPIEPISRLNSQGPWKWPLDLLLYLFICQFGNLFLFS